MGLYGFAIVNVEAGKKVSGKLFTCFLTDTLVHIVCAHILTADRPSSLRVPVRQF
jgi:hypothetical protein